MTSVVIMAGGKGERFWPKSRINLPKQFLSLTDDGKSMIQHTVERVKKLVDIENVYVVTNEMYKNLVLEHIPDDTQAMKELYRVMKLGGWGIFQVPMENDREITFEDNSITDPKERTRIFGQYDHVRIYGKDYSQKLKKVGFQVEMIPYAKRFTAEEIERYRIVFDELIPLCAKGC